MAVACPKKRLLLVAIAGVAMSAWSPFVQAAHEAACRFGDLKSMSVENPQGEKLGKVEDLVYDGRTGRIRYAAVSFGGFLGVGDKLFAVPWHALKPELHAVDNKQRLLMNADKKSLEKAPGFDKDKWPDLADPKWSEEVDRFYPSQQTLNSSRNRTEGPGARASTLTGMEVRNDKGEALGKVNEIVIDMKAGRIRYAALSFGGFLGVGDKLFAVPFDTLRANKDRDSKNYHIVLNVDKAALEKAPGFNQDKWPNFADPNWSVAIDQHYRRGFARRSHPGATAFKSDDLVGMKVENAQGEDLGKVNSLVIDLKTGKVRYAALSFGGFLGVGDKLFAMPWEAMKVRYDSEHEENRVVLNVDKTRLEKAPGFNADKWPNVADPKWAGDLHAYYGFQSTAGDGDMVVKLDDLTGMEVKNPQGEKLGKIDEVVIDLAKGQTRYAAMSFGGFLGVGDKLFAVPWTQINFQRAADSQKFTAVVRADKQSLEKAPSFDQNNWPDFADPDWSRDIDKHYLSSATPASPPAKR